MDDQLKGCLDHSLPLQADAPDRDGQTALFEVWRGEGLNPISEGLGFMVEGLNPIAEGLGLRFRVNS